MMTLVYSPTRVGQDIKLHRVISAQSLQKHEKGLSIRVLFASKKRTALIADTCTCLNCLKCKFMNDLVRIAPEYKMLSAPVEVIYILM